MIAFVARNTHDLRVRTAVEAALRDLNASKVDLANAIGRSETTLQGYLNPARTVRRETLARLSAGLNTVAEQLGISRRWTIADLLDQPADAALAAESEPGPPREDVQAVMHQALSKGHALRTASGWEPCDEVIDVERILIEARHLGDVPCGTPVDLSDRGLGDLVVVDRRSVGPHWRSETCVLVTAKGRSMEDYHITSGSQLTIDSDCRCASGSIVVAWVNGGTAVRRLVQVEDGWELQPGADGYKTIHVTELDELHIVGVVTWCQPPGFAVGD